ncbi:MAG TPA: Smr/MutS family protein [Bacteroidota bacterium]
MNSLRILDIAHPPMRADDAEKVLDELLRSMKKSAGTRVLKIIHGYGKSGRGGTLKETVLNWSYRNKRRIRGVIAGEQYSVHNKLTQEMRRVCGQVFDSDLEAANPGVTIIWVV